MNIFFLEQNSISRAWQRIILSSIWTYIVIELSRITTTDRTRISICILDQEVVGHCQDDIWSNKDTWTWVKVSLTTAICQRWAKDWINHSSRCCWLTFIIDMLKVLSAIDNGSIFFSSFRWSCFCRFQNALSLYLWAFFFWYNSCSIHFLHRSIRISTIRDFFRE